MEQVISQIFSHYGPAAIPWVIGGVLFYMLWKERHSSEDLLKPYHDFIESYRELVEACHEAIQENTKILERLAVLIEERTRNQNAKK